MTNIVYFLLLSSLTTVSFTYTLSNSTNNYCCFFNI